MKINVKELNPNFDLEITGQEPWLERIYGDFPVDPETPRPTISGHLVIELEEAGTVVVRGRLAYAPVVPCSRCAFGVSCPLDLRISTRFLPAAYNETPREKNLSMAELDAYYIEDDMVDLEQLLNDEIQTAIPSQLTPSSESDPSCPACKNDLSGGKVYGPEDSKTADTSPFAKLRDLKLKH